MDTGTRMSRAGLCLLLAVLTWFAFVWFFPLKARAEEINQTVNAKAENDQRLTLGFGGAPNLSADATECDMESRSWSILIWSWGRSKCSKESVLWRDLRQWTAFVEAYDVKRAVSHSVAWARICQVKSMRDALRENGLCLAKEYQPLHEVRDH